MAERRNPADDQEQRPTEIPGTEIREFEQKTIHPEEYEVQNTADLPAGNDEILF